MVLISYVMHLSSRGCNINYYYHYYYYYYCKYTPPGGAKGKGGTHTITLNLQYYVSKLIFTTRATIWKCYIHLKYTIKIMWNIISVG